MENNSERSKIDRIKKRLKSILSNSTVHAVPNITRTKNKLVIILWSIFLFFSTGICSYFILDSIFEYYEYNTNTKIETIFESSSEFPEITVCNLNIFTTPYAFEFLNNLSRENQIDIFNQSDDLASFKTMARSALPILSFEKRSKMSFSSSEFIFKCSFNYIPCDVQNFTEIFDKYYGKCFKFNPVTQNFKTGLIYGLNLILNVWFDESLDFFNENIGALIRINNPSFRRINNSSFRSAESELDVQLSVGHDTSILLDKRVEKRLKKPYSKCEYQEDSQDDYDSEFVKLLREKGIRYSLKYCLSNCYQKYLISLYNCTDAEEFSFYDNVHDCVSKKEVENIIGAYYTFIDTKYKECLSVCPIECDKNRIIATQTSSKMFSVRNKTKLLRFFENKNYTQLTPDIIRNSLVKLQINYDSFSYTKMSEFPSKNLVSVISDIGGIIGLFLGMSLLSLVEIFEILIEIISIAVNKI